MKSASKIGSSTSFRLAWTTRSAMVGIPGSGASASSGSVAGAPPTAGTHGTSANPEFPQETHRPRARPRCSGRSPCRPRCAGALIRRHPIPRDQQERRIVNEIKKVIEPATRIPPPTGAVWPGSSVPRTPPKQLGQATAPVFTGASCDITIPSLTDTLASFAMHAALARPEYYGGAAPPAPSADVAPIPARPSGRPGTWSARDGSRVHCHPINGLAPGSPLRHRHSYAVGLHHGLKPRRNDQAWSSPAICSRRVRTANRPQSTRFRAGYAQEAWRSRFLTYTFPSRSPHPARPAVLADPTLSRLLPPSPPTPGLDCLQLHPAAATAEPWRSRTSFRTHSASWRTFLAYTFPSRSPRPAHPAVPGRRDCRGCSRPPRRPPAQAASSFTPPLRRRGDGRSFTSIRNDSASRRTQMITRMERATATWALALPRRRAIRP